jgi:hypothetical protein
MLVNQIDQAGQTDPAAQAAARRVKQSYLGSNRVQALGAKAQEILGFDSLEELSQDYLLVLSRTSKRGVILSKPCYQKHILGKEEVGQGFRNTEWASGSLFDDEESDTTLAALKKDSDLQPFPLLSDYYAAQKWPAHVERFMSLLRLEPERLAQFKTARADSGSTLKLVGLKETEELMAVFTPLLPEGIISDQHTKDILNCFSLPPETEAGEAAGVLFACAALFVKYSSESIFGTENNSPYPLRCYASALLNKAVVLAPGLSPPQVIKDFNDRLLGKGGGFSCTNVLFNLMRSDAMLAAQSPKGRYFNLIIPNPWK